MLRKNRVLHGEQRWENLNGEEIIGILLAREADPRERRIYLEQAPYKKLVAVHRPLPLVAAR
jgi:hypothetical protein